MNGSDLDPQNKMLLIRDRKDPRKKKGNDQRIPLASIPATTPGHSRRATRLC